MMDGYSDPSSPAVYAATNLPMINVSLYEGAEVMPHVCLDCLQLVTIGPGNDVEVCGGPRALTPGQVPAANGCGAVYHQACVGGYRSWQVWKCKNPACKIGVAQDIDPTDEIIARAIDQWVAHNGSWYNFAAISQRRRTFSSRKWGERS